VNEPVYRYKVDVIRVIDGDTIVMDVDLGFNTWVRKVKFRLKGINAPELSTPEGKDALLFILSCLPKYGSNQITADTIKPDKYGNRWDAVVYLGNINLNEYMVENGHAVKVNW
jgi:micrococcal nuclease